MVPDNLAYTDKHEWIATAAGAGRRVGITHHAQDALGDVVFVQLPEVGEKVTAGVPFGEVESTKTVSDVYAPISGEVVARNEALLATPELVNTDPYGEGWLIEIAPTEIVTTQGTDGASQLLDAVAYGELIERE